MQFWQLGHLRGLAVGAVTIPLFHASKYLMIHFRDQAAHDRTPNGMKWLNITLFGEKKSAWNLCKIGNSPSNTPRIAHAFPHLLPNHFDIFAANLKLILLLHIIFQIINSLTYSRCYTCISTYGMLYAPYVNYEICGLRYIIVFK